MNDATNGDHSNALVDRARNILLKPHQEWPKIAVEPAGTADILLRYVLPLAAIGPVASFVGSQLFGYGALGFTYRPSLISSLSSAIVAYVMSLVGILVLGLVADFLAPKFGGASSRDTALKLVAYSWTAAMLAGAFELIPSLGFLVILGSLYSIYLFYTGSAPLMKVPQDKSAAYTAIAGVCAVVLFLVAGAFGRTLVGAFVPGPTYMSDSGAVGGRLSVPGVGTLDLDKAQEAAEQAAANGKAPAVDPAQLQALLPASVAGYQRTATETNALGGMGSAASGTYSAGGKSFHLKITDLAAVGALAALGSAAGIAQSREDANGYERTASVNGRMQSERWDRASSSGKFGVVVANRFMVEADGSAASIDELKNAVAAVDESALTELIG